MSEAFDEQLMAAVKRRRAVVNAEIPDEIPAEDPERLWSAARHLLDAGGKRLRPTVLMMVAEALTDADPETVDYRSFETLTGGEVDLVRAAVSVEIVHTFTLIHDDIMDDDDLRRGVEAVHEVYDEEMAIIAGDTLYAKAFDLMLNAGATPERTNRALELLTETCTKICVGQALDVDFETRREVLPDEYLEMIDHKTAVLYGASAGIPAILMGADQDTVESVYRFGRQVGQAFQIQDDVLDLTTPSEKLGKRRGSDLIEGKQTIITVHARDQGVDVDSLLPDEGEITEADVDDAVAILEAAGSIDYARDMAQELVVNGKAHLRTLPDNEVRRYLSGIADYLIERDY